MHANLPPKVVLFGSIGTLIETSEMQRDAFNSAFAEAGLDWVWDKDTYIELLKSSGGVRRIDDFAQSRGEDVDATAIHARKSELFQNALSAGQPLRPGVLDVVRDAKARGLKLGLVTTTSAHNVNAILGATEDILTRSDFDYVGTSDPDILPKPSPQSYQAALSDLGLIPGDAIAIEDTPICARAALDAEIPTVAFPGMYSDNNFGDVLDVVSTLTPQIMGLHTNTRLAS